MAQIIVRPNVWTLFNQIQGVNKGNAFCLRGIIQSIFQDKMPHMRFVADEWPDYNILACTNIDNLRHIDGAMSANLQPISESDKRFLGHRRVPHRDDMLFLTHNPNKPESNRDELLVNSEILDVIKWQYINVVYADECFKETILSRANKKTNVNGKLDTRGEYHVWYDPREISDIHQEYDKQRRDLPGDYKFVNLRPFVKELLETWVNTTPGSEYYFNFILRHFNNAGIVHKEDGLVSHRLQYCHGEYGHAFTDETHRNKGLSLLLVNKLALAGKQNGQDYFVKSTLDNNATVNMYDRIGLIKTDDPMFELIRSLQK